ncbi:hypothetical protein NDN08_000800 [Rhodosorus marinus]|uniref:U3 small nucleolar RNA-associated protein 13 C-terminal domain-containing protein n=1 Tax=Rhodosorus marinus TaxID=101924 RepID=A0AAV8USL4_9RHOD|nr:hypothetical protein NDN08_000800 [Rhodosorus marinus]
MSTKKRKERTDFELEKKLNAVYLGGRLASAGNKSSLILFPRGDSVAVASIDPRGKISIHDELTDPNGSDITALAVSERGDRLAIGSNNGFVTTWIVPVDITSRSVSLRNLQDDDDDELDISLSKAEKSTSQNCASATKFRAFPNSSVSCIAFDISGGLVVVGSPDGNLRVFDAEAGHCTHSFTVGSAGGGSGILCVLFRESLEIFVGTEMGDIEKFDLVTRKSMTLKHHAKGVTSLALFNANRSLVSSGRDGILTVWNCHEGKVQKTIVAEESLETLAVCDNETKACTTGENGGIRFWDLKTSSEVLRRKEYGNVSDLTLAGDVLVASKVEGDVLSLDPTDGTQRSLTVGNLDEIYDAKVLGRHIAIASNSNDVRILTPTDSDIWDHSASLSGHANVVLAIDVGGEFIASSSKDKTARVWKFNEEEYASSLICVAEGHTDAVGAVALAKKQKKQPSRDFFVTGAADKTVKLWSLSNVSAAKKVSALWTVLAHEKDINCVEVSPDNKIIASGSQDRTVKLWRRTDSTLIATCKGHRRGVWSVCFSPVDVVVVSASADKTIKAWNSANGTCLRTIEGHGAAVLKVLFISSGTQIASAGADGMVRIWDAREGSQSAEIDAHSDRVWSLSSISDGDRIVSGAANGTLRIWKDVSERVRQEQLEESYQRTLKDQAVSDSIRNQDWSAAFRGGVELSQPRKVEHIVATVLKSEDGLEALNQAIKELCTEDESVKKLLEFCRDWNAVGGSVSMVAVTHAILRVIFTTVRMDRLADIFKASSDKAILDALVAHSRRHYERVRGMSSAVSFLDFTLHRMLSLGEVKEGARKEKQRSKREAEDYRGNSGISENQSSGIVQKRQFSALYEGMDELRREAKQQSRNRRRRSEGVVS